MPMWNQIVHRFRISEWEYGPTDLFYEFKELNPIGEQGDDVIIAIAKRLVRLDLLENAADLLRHQINHVFL